ncbi:N-acetyllactosaminide beta-1,3-N-acetylglucosaminyltransferase 3-like [Trichomycterus rosablanca]|uniref:N-acetyllactosaminide beta-1,3-N-acetylglucosaminyltransferase 3-like n=1 Tax=Trichomycterus rosablanca TaxID=2290929 RepID=UPI002F35CABA
MKVLRGFYGSKRCWRRLELAALVTMTILCLLMFFRSNTQDQTVKLSRKGRKEVAEARTAPTVPTSPPAPPPTLPPTPKCERNESAFNISGFSSLPGNIQDFLLYKHCRDFPILLDVPRKCGGARNSGNIFLLLVIKSSPANYERRAVLRKTWAAERLQSGKWIRTVFISGTSGKGFEKERLNKLLEIENREHRDVLQWDFDDSFYNLTLKQMLFLSWMERRCPDARFLLNGDDDIFANTNNVVEFLKGLDDDQGSRHLFVGHLIYNVGPIRDPGSKYFIPVQVQESERYPPYCGGGGFLLSLFTARTIHNQSRSIGLLPIDDVYMGMCLERAGLRPEPHMGIRLTGLRVPSENVDSYNPCFYREILLVHRFIPHQIFFMWHEVNRKDLNCSVTL